MLQLIPQSFGQVRHLIPGSCFAAVKPIEQLRHAVGRAFPFLELLPQLFLRLGFNVALHQRTISAEKAGRKDEIQDETVAKKSQIQGCETLQSGLPTAGKPITTTA